MSSIYREIWKSELKKKGYPVRYKGLIKLQYEDLKIERSNNIDDGIKIIKKLVNGYVLLVKHAFSEKFVSDVKKIKLFGKITLIHFIKC